MNPARYPEVDCLRGIAVVMMLVSNLVTTLDFFGPYGSFQHPFWYWLASVTAFGFVSIAGLSVTLSVHRGRLTTGARSPAALASTARGGVKVIAWALVVTAVTWLAIPEAYVRWGVLHLIGFGIVVSLPLVDRTLPAALLGAGLIVWGYGVDTVRVDFSWLVWLGYRPLDFQSQDYFPVIPWYGFFLTGLVAGNLLYPGGVRRYARLRLAAHLDPAGVLIWLGSRTLVIYLIHLPVYVAALLALGVIPLSSVIPAG